jgi:hypothetical protein
VHIGISRPSWKIGRYGRMITSHLPILSTDLTMAATVELYSGLEDEGKARRWQGYTTCE